MAKTSAKLLHIVCFSFLLWDCSYNANAQTTSCSKLQGMFTFGSSVVDNGNTVFAGRTPPYGVDFPGGPNGRPSNGKTVADQIAERLNLKSSNIPSFLDTQNNKTISIINGVTFGFSGSGILNETGQIMNASSLSNQITNFETVTLPALECNLGAPRTKILRGYLFMIAAGSNECMGYLLGKFNSTPDEFVDMLISNYFGHVKRLYDLGARNFLLLSVYPLKCSPRFNEGKLCKEDQNDVSTIFYNKLICMVDKLKTETTDAQFVVVNAAKIVTDVVNNAESEGFTNVMEPCCQLDSHNVSCSPEGASAVCQNRTDHAYFDALHGTEALNDILAAKACSSMDLSEVHPYNVEKLVIGI